ncbi:MAG: permease-like cell division protein FtsX [Eubacteriales bacterium]|nr:permease-like cell division protein FtsX [Eubacteriales bacterium]MDY3333062.1 permease-like cell division protein FtsX [Gallibacter sp.]
MSKFLYALRQAFKQIRRNKVMSFTSTFAITAMMLILGLFLMLIINISATTESIKKDYKNIEIFYKDNVSMETIEKDKGNIESWKEVKSVKIRTKTEAMKVMKERWGDNGKLLDGLDENPLPNSIIIEVDSIEKADSIAEKAKAVKGIEDINYYKSTVDKLIKFTDGLRLAGTIIMIFLIIVSTVVVSNTIKLTVLNRKDEILIMSDMGATNWFIRAPFFLEGILIGIFSALLSCALVSSIYVAVLNFLSDEFQTIMSLKLVPSHFVSVNLLIIFISLGISIGASGSIISMRRFLYKGNKRRQVGNFE